jgi:hypothetical protein
MQDNERDPEAIVRRLLKSERHLSARARDEVLALGAGAVPALLRILDNEVLEGWAPVHAVSGAVAERSTRGATSIPMRTPRAVVRCEYEPIVYERAPTGTAGNAAGDGIRAGKLQYRRNSAHGNPFLRLLRREVEALVKNKHGVDFLKERQTNTELAQINRELKRLKLQLAALEKRRSQLVAAIGK